MNSMKHVALHYVLAGFLSSATLAFSLPTLAIVPAPGSFVPSECGTLAIEGSPAFDASVLNLTAVCAGRLALAPGEAGDGKAFEFRFADGESGVFRVVGSATPFIFVADGFAPVTYRLESLKDDKQAVVRATISNDGAIQSMAGLYQGAAFECSSVEPVFVIQ